MCPITHILRVRVVLNKQVKLNDHFLVSDDNFSLVRSFFNLFVVIFYFCVNRGEHRCTAFNILTRFINATI